MEKIIKKIFSLKDLKYTWLLLISFIAFYTIFYLDLLNEPSYVQITALAGYGCAFITASVSSVFNYINLIKFNIMYKKSSNINAFLDQLTVSREEKLEIQGYLDDYIEDLIASGKQRTDAIREAIESFKVKEILSSSKNSKIFNLHAHYYLLGYSFIMVTAGLFLRVIYLNVNSLLLLSLEWLLYLYGIGFAVLFVIYKLFDIVLYKKIDEH